MFRKEKSCLEIIFQIIIAKERHFFLFYRSNTKNLKLFTLSERKDYYDTKKTLYDLIGNYIIMKIKMTFYLKGKIIIMKIKMTFYLKGKVIIMKIYNKFI